jgi:hypothetical protein
MLNRSDIPHLFRLRQIVVPNVWDPNPLVYSPLPQEYPSSANLEKLLIVHQPSQVFGGYEFGRLVRWGPVSSGRKATSTPSGLFHLNWRSRRRHSTDNANWILEWYFNFQNQRGISFHQYALPGYPASHACVRLLESDAQWLYRWGHEWQLDEKGTEVIELGTTLLILADYDFDAPPPWKSVEWLAAGIDLPETLRP